MKCIQFSLVEGNDRYISINIPYDEKVWDEIIERYLPREDEADREVEWAQK